MPMLFLRAAGETLLVTRVDEAKARAMGQQLPDLCYHPQARCITLGEAMKGAPWQRLALLTGAAVIRPWAGRGFIASCPAGPPGPVSRPDCLRRESPRDTCSEAP